MSFFAYIITSCLFLLTANVSAQDYSKEFNDACRKCFSSEQADYLEMCKNDLKSRAERSFTKHITPISVFYMSEDNGPQYIDKPLILNPKTGIKNLLNQEGMVSICNESKDANPSACFSDLFDKYSAGGILKETMRTYNSACTIINEGLPDENASSEYGAIILDKMNAMSKPGEESQWIEILKQKEERDKLQTKKYHYSLKLRDCLRPKIEDYGKEFIGSYLDFAIKQYRAVNGEAKQTFCSDLKKLFINYFRDAHVTEYFYKQLESSILNSELMKNCKISSFNYPGGDNICDETQSANSRVPAGIKKTNVKEK